MSVGEPIDVLYGHDLRDSRHFHNSVIEQPFTGSAVSALNELMQRADIDADYSFHDDRLAGDHQIKWICTAKTAFGSDESASILGPRPKMSAAKEDVAQASLFATATELEAVLIKRASESSEASKPIFEVIPSPTAGQ